ncbi:MAG: hypothetical protein ACYDC8_03040 [Gammaproteobacteria bacterium]
MKKFNRYCFGMLALLAGAAGLVAPVQASTVDVTVSVDSQAMPWLWDTTSLNTTSQFGVQDGVGPALVDASSGIDFTAGGGITITYLSGLTSPYGGTPYADGNGDTGYAADGNGGSSGKYFPSRYMNPSSYPVYLNALVGTFADSAGNIVGTPFAVGNGPLNVLIPVGASRLQLGLNDDIFSDNTGTLRVQVTGPAAVPLPLSAWLFGSGLMGLLGIARRKQAVQQ